MTHAVDAVALTQRLIQCASVTPNEGGALVLLNDVLTAAGFTCTRVDRGGVCNLFARWGRGKNGRTFGFNGHTDVVPVGDENAWTVDPFGGEIRDSVLYGRGATDMKSGVAAFAAAAVDFVRQTPPDGSIVMAITGDEEGNAKDGTVALLDWMQAHGERLDHCLVGEPTCPTEMGEMIKIGRRGSMTAFFTIEGKQGHSAYPHRANNPLNALVRLMDRLASHTLDEGTDHFDPSSLALTTIDTGNPANNVIPARAKATVNIRFNDAHSAQTLTRWLRAESDRTEQETGTKVLMEIDVSGDSFVTEPGELSELVANVASDMTGRTPTLSTSGGTSDARFVKDHCPVVEFGLVGKTMHQVDECVPVEQITQLTEIYSEILRRYFAT